MEPLYSLQSADEIVNQCLTEKRHLERSSKLLAERKAKLQEQVEQTEAQLQSLTDDCQSLTDEIKLLSHKLATQHQSYTRIKEIYEKKKAHAVQLNTTLSDKCSTMNDDRFAHFKEFMNIYHELVDRFLHPFARKIAGSAMGSALREDADVPVTKSEADITPEQPEIKEHAKLNEKMELV
ncbi:unnamed protein product [Dicrocoelium dendriticum]|nr:unnamed protein product [Dicrocoelium dendriticum]